MASRGAPSPATNGTMALPTSSSNGSAVRVWLDTNQLYDNSSSSSSIQQPQTQQFANFEATPSDILNGTVIDVNAHVVVYTVKNGLIRVLHRHSTLRTLLRAHHQQTVTDIRFFQDGDVLATVANNASSGTREKDKQTNLVDLSTIVIWRIYEGAADIVSDKILEISTPHMHITRVIWHPFNPNQFFMIHQNKNMENASLGPNVATLVETTSISTRRHTADTTETHAVCEFAAPHVIRHGAIQLSTLSGGNLTDLVWSGRDTRHVMTTHDSGEVILWDLQQTTTNASLTTGAAPYTLTPMRLATIPNASERGPITRCLFLPHENISGSNGATSNDDNSACLTTCFATASDNNSIITLWSPFLASSSNTATGTAAPPLPTKIQVLGLEQQQQQPVSTTSYLVDVVFGPAPPDASPPSCFLLMADRSSGKILALHVRAAWSSDNNKSSSQQQHRSVLLEGCDYVVPFTTRYPTYAWSVVVNPTTDIAEEALTEQGSLIFDMKLFAYQSRLVQCLTLTSYMCLPPSSTTTTASSISSNDVVRVEPLLPSGGGGSSSNVSEIDENDIVAATKNLTLEHYDEDYDVGEDEDDDGQDDDDDDVNADAGGARTTAPVQPSPPPPALAVGVGNPFANWLGAIAGSSFTSTTTAAAVPAPPPPGLLTPPPGVKAMMLTTPAAPPATSLPSPIGTMPGLAGGANGLLSPNDFVIVPPAATAAAPSPAAAIVPPTKKADNKKEKRGKKSSAIVPSPSSPPPAAASSGGVQLLKRDAVEIKNVSAPSPTLPTAAAPASAAVVDMQEMRLIVREEVQSQVVPAVERAVSQALQPMQRSIQDLVQRGVSVDHDKIALTMAESIDEPLQAAIAQTIKTVLIPTLESMAGQIFGKVSHGLDQGLSAAASAAAASAAAAVANGGGSGGSDPRLEAISTQLSTMTALVTELTGEVQSLRATVSAQQTAVAAAAATHQPAQQKPPAETIETVKGEIIKLLSEKNYEKAFTRAVSSTTAELAVFCCSHADLSEVLGADEVQLSQPILICLMQQLGTVVGSPQSLPSHSSSLQVELDWLQDIALSLDTKDMTIQQHIPGVLRGLVTNINARLAEGGGDPALRRPLQRLLSILRGIRIG